LPPNGVPALNLSTIIWRYVRQFVKMDAKEALQYVYCICLSADQGSGVGKEQIENAWELVRRIIVLANAGTAWEELVGGFRADGTRFVSFHAGRWADPWLTPEQSGIIEQGASLLKLTSTQDYHTEILVRAAKHSEQNDRTPEAIKLYNLAGDYGTVISCLASALGTTVSRPAPDETSKAIEKTAVDILRHYERTNRAVGRDREAVTKLLRIREAMNAKEVGRPEIALEVRPESAL
jgi:nuclear pore complex protein Nup93